MALVTIIWNLLQRINALDSANKALTEENLKLKEQVQNPEKTSDNSSIPPSRRRYSTKKPTKRDENGNPIKGKPGAKAGHKAHHRKKATSDKKKSEEVARKLPVE
jgi:hypothetical protein